MTDPITSSLHFTDCPSGKRGDDCNLNCTSTNCLYNQCDRYDDTCKACPLTYYGNLCAQSCPNCREGNRYYQLPFS